MGLFITVEGTDGAGKSTQTAFLYDWLSQNGYHVFQTREPGGHAISEQIRKLLIDPGNAGMDFMTEALLYAAARAQLVATVIRPRLSRGEIVLCDRFVDSSVVYQGIARGLGKAAVKEINQYATGNLRPDITFFLDLPAKAAMRRKRNFSQLDRLERENYEFHEKVWGGYADILKEEPNRIKRIDANQPREQVRESILLYIKELLLAKGL